MNIVTSITAGPLALLLAEDAHRSYTDLDDAIKGISRQCRQINKNGHKNVMMSVNVHGVPLKLTMENPNTPRAQLLHQLSRHARYGRIADEALMDLFTRPRGKKSRES